MTVIEHIDKMCAWLRDNRGATITRDEVLALSDYDILTALQGYDLEIRRGPCNCDKEIIGQLCYVHRRVFTPKGWIDL